jgi:hypothetical protein
LTQTTVGRVFVRLLADDQRRHRAVVDRPVLTLRLPEPQQHTPRTTSGFLLSGGQSITLSASDATNAKFISTSATVGTINAVYTL